MSKVLEKMATISLCYAYYPTMWTVQNFIVPLYFHLFVNVCMTDMLANSS